MKWGLIIFLCQASNYDEAGHKAAEAAYKQTGLEENVNKFIDKQKDKMPNEFKTIGGILYPVIKTITTQRVEVKYEF